MSQEFSSLCDLVLARGVQHSQLLSQIKTAVLLEFSKNYPQKTAELEVSVDEQNGKVRLFKLGKDITPSEFGPIAEEAARKVLVDLLWQNEQGKIVSEKPVIYHENKLGGFLGQAIFWGYNFSYLFILFVVVLGFFNTQTDMSWWEKVKELGVFRGILMLLFALIPLGTLIYVFKTKLYKNSTQLLKTFFILEVPLVLATFIPFNIFKKPIASVAVYTFLFLMTPILMVLSKRIHELTSTNKRLAIMLIQQYSLQLWLYLLVLFIFFVPIILGGYARLVFGPLINSLMPYRY